MQVSSIRALAFPIILSNITIPLLGAVDLAIMGRMEQAAYMGAVALGALVFDYIYWGFGFLRLSTTSLTGQALGRNAPGEVRLIWMRAVFIALVGAALLWIFQSLILQIALSSFQASEEVEGLMATYFKVRIWAAPAALLNYVIIGWLLAHQKTRLVLVQQIVTNGMNTVLSLWFVLGLNWAIEGVAGATVLAQYCGLFFGLFYVVKFMGRKADLKDRFWNATAFKKVLSMNADLFIRTICLLSAFAWFASEGAKLGDVTLAANAILLQFLQFCAFSLDGFAHAVEILSAHALGARARHVFKEAVRASTLWALGFALSFTVVYALFGNPLIALFTDLEPVREAARSYLPWMIGMPLVAVWSYQLDGIYFGLGKTHVLRNMMILSLLLFIALSFALIEGYGNHGLWAAFTFFMSLRAITLGMTLKPIADKEFP